MRNTTACDTPGQTAVSEPARTPPARSVPGYPATAPAVREYARVRMPYPWGLWSDDGNGRETWINGNDHSEVWVFPEFHELIWIEPGPETLADWPEIDSPMGYPSRYSPVECVIPDCVICGIVESVRELLTVIGVTV